MHIASRPTIIATLAIASSLAGVGAAIAANSATPTTVTVTPVPALQAGDTAPGSAPGVKAIRENKPIPSGYVLIGQKVDVQRGDWFAGAALRFSCPGEKRLRTFLITGQAGFGADRQYFNHKAAYVVSMPNHKLEQASGVVYAVCR
jgi:hypothetical protein